MRLPFCHKLLPSPALATSKQAMTEICRQHYWARLLVIVLSSGFALCYENAYDLAERRRDPNNRYYETSSSYYNRYQDGDRYSTHNRNPSSVYSSVRSDDPGFVLSRRSTVGNGYDNLGNTGIAPVRRRDWNRISEPLADRRFEPLADRRLDTFADRGLEPLSDRRLEPLSDRRLEPLSERRLDTFIDRRSDPLADRRFDDRRWNEDRPLRGTFRGDPFEDRRDSFRNHDILEDSRPIDHLRDTRLDDDRLSLDLSGNPDSLDDRRTLDAVRGDEGSTIDDRIGESRILPSIRRSGFDSLDSLHRRPDFYRSDYFVPSHHSHPHVQKSSGFDSANAEKNYKSAGGGKEDSGAASVGSFVSSNEDLNQKKTDSGFKDKKEGTSLDVIGKEKVGESTRFDKNGGNKSTVRSNRVSKKGHATKGFATHHHKDETGNTTTFFDESNDSGGQSDYQDLEDEFGTRRTMEVLNGKEDGRFFQEKGGRTGNFGSGVLKDNKKVEKDVVSKDKKFNSEERFGDGQQGFDKGFKTASEYLGGGVWDDHHHY